MSKSKVVTLSQLNNPGSAQTSGFTVGRTQIHTLGSLESSGNVSGLSRLLRNQDETEKTGLALGQLVGSRQNPETVQFIERPLTRFNLPTGIQHYPQIAPQNLYDALTSLPFQQINWKGRNLHRLACRISPQELPFYPVLQNLITRTWSSLPTLSSLAITGFWINQYRDGNDYTPYHQDQYGCYVCTISIGSTRRLLTKNLTTKARATGIDCADGDLVIFSPEWDNNNQHSVPKTKKQGSRISIVIFCQ